MRIDKIKTDLLLKRGGSVFFCHFFPMKSNCAGTGSQLYYLIEEVIFIYIASIPLTLEKGGFLSGKGTLYDFGCSKYCAG